MYTYDLNDIEYLASVCNCEFVTLHWSASGYTYTSDHYHLNIDGDGNIYSNYDNFDIILSHTYMRNTGNIGITLACCSDAIILEDGTVRWGKYPPTDAQIETLAKVVSAISKGMKRDIDDSWVKTHWEWAEIDGYGVFNDIYHDGDIRWDLIHLPNKLGNGGDIIREEAIEYAHN